MAFILSIGLGLSISNGLILKDTDLDRDDYVVNHIS